MNLNNDTKTIKMSSKGRVVIPATFREKMGLSSGDYLQASLDAKGELCLEKLPSALDWQDLVAGIPIERVDFDEAGKYDATKSPNFDEWMHEE
ncbi:AbrB/MazE/SpoVT family DNA-binding domain-containing protein [Levilactobacillus fuyuanensis]|uniref:AbrB/MazE/SpoVT family DNA-binding domain-containing protein n=1 Tax=Levilactobacillus fuyuanensis TaxID=2486022 RepID=A0ABW4H2Z3_9LACO|nr:AbrB/MazE/SpoVT family DNA-binding domain-containing protein [Levilactobacillus fuyuanensis]